MSLVELLLALGIIALLGGLIFAGGLAAQRRVNRVNCQANLLQMGVAIRMYVADCGRLPLVHYSPSIKVPGATYPDPRPAVPPPRGHTIAVSLGSYVSDPDMFLCPATRRAWPGRVYEFNPTASGLRLSQVRVPPHRALIMTDIWQDNVRRLHGGYRNVLFLDGHVKAYRAVWEWPVYMPNDDGSGKWPFD